MDVLVINDHKSSFKNFLRLLYFIINCNVVSLCSNMLPSKLTRWSFRIWYFKTVILTKIDFFEFRFRNLSFFDLLWLSYFRTKNIHWHISTLNLDLTIFGPFSNHHVIFWSNVAPFELMWPLVPFKTSHMTDGTTKEWSPGTLFRFQNSFPWIFMVS